MKEEQSLEFFFSLSEVILLMTICWGPGVGQGRSYFKGSVCVPVTGTERGRRYLTVECKVTQPRWFMTHNGWKIHSCWHPDLSPSCWKLWRMRISYTAKGEILRPFYPMDYSRKTPTPIERDPETLRKTWCVGATPWASPPSAPICTPAITG